MWSKNLQDQRDNTLGDLFSGLSDPFAGFFAPPGHKPGGSPPSGPPVFTPELVIPDEAVEAQAAQNGSGGTNSVAAQTSGGLTINLIFDAAAMAAPASFRAGIQQAAAILSGAITDKITINLKIDYSGTGGGAAAGPDNGQFINYSTVRADLVNNASPGDTTFNALPTGTSIQGQTNIAVWNAQLKLFGLLGANDTTTDDGAATFATDINPNLLVGVALHELTHALGRVPYGPQPDIFDFYRFTTTGTRLLANGSTAPAAYFSLDGGTTKLADFGQTSDPSDFLNTGVQGPNDAFNEFYSGSTIQGLTTVDKQILDALGFHLASTTPPPPTTTVIEAIGATSLVQVGSNYFLNAISSGTGPELKFSGAPVTTGEFVISSGTYVPIGVEPTSTGYEVAWRIPGVDQFSVWTTDSSGNYTGNLYMPGSGTSPALESLETSFQQDLNGDGVIGIRDIQPPTVGTDNPLSLLIGATQAITSSQLSASDNVSSAAQLHFTVTTAPTHGTLLLNGSTATSFTQADINSGLVSYHETASGVTSDSFQFTVTDAAGNVTAIDTFQFLINGTVVTATHPPEDFNGDSKSDILWQRNDGTVSIWDSGQIGNAHWISNPGVVPSSSHIAGIGDFDGNGHSDVLWRDDNGSVFVWNNGQPGSAQTLAAAGVVPSGWHIVGTGDFDGNGKSDILWQRDDGTVAIWDNGQITGAHWISNPGVVPSTSHIVGTGDFDGNGKSDILWRDDNGAVFVWNNGQPGSAQTLAAAGTVASSWHIVGTGDFDGNGKTDILWQNDNGAVQIWDNGQLAGAHTISNPGVLPTSWHVADVADYDGNGKSDILWQNTDGTVMIWDNGQPANAHTAAAAGVIPSGWHIA